MQATVMPPLRSLYSPKHFLNIHKLTSSKPSQNPYPIFSSLFHSTIHRFSQDSTSFDFPTSPSPNYNKTPTVSTIYDPITRRLVTKKSFNHQQDPDENQSNFSGINYENGFPDRVYGNVKKENLGIDEFVVSNQKGLNHEQDPESSKNQLNLSGFNYDNKLEGTAYGGVKKRNLGIEEFVVNNRRKGKSKVKIAWVCCNCGYSDGQWWGICKACDSVGTLKQFSQGIENNGDSRSGFQVSENRSWLPQKPHQKLVEAEPMRLTEVSRGINEKDWRIRLSGLFGAEVAMVLGGGLVPGSLVLVGGDPGVGKSTLLLQIAGMIAEGHSMGESAPVVYVSGEESVEQIGDRADRLRIGAKELFLYSSTDVEDILEKVQRLSPQARVLIVDSIQTVYLRGVAGSAGGLYQVKECTSALLRFAKKTNIPVLLSGHVTKSGEIAGPRVLEHIVDVVLYMEGEKYSSHRLLRSVKNRFGSTDELGVFEMSQSGLQAVSNASEMFLTEQHSDSEVLAGLAVAVIMDGSRTFVIEIQALCVTGSSTLRQVNGVKASRADMIISVLMKQAGLKLQENGIFLNVVSGVTLNETAGDLAIAAAICSSFLEYPIPSGIAFIGELGLGGELRGVPRMEKRVKTVAKLGYKKCIVPKSVEKSVSVLGLEEIEILGCRNLKEMINTVFTTTMG